MNNDKRIKIAYIGGGSFNFGWKLFSELAAEEICATVNLYDKDKQLSLTNEVIGNNLREDPRCKSDIIFLACDSPEDALKDADIVLMSISRSSADDEAALHSIIEKYGIIQTSGEQTGPIGVINALRILPDHIKYAELIKKHCPNAWIINLSNPMSECMDIMVKAFPEIKIFGSSNELFQTLEFIGGLVETEKGITNVRRRDIKYNLIGISGFSWFDKISYNGEDIMPIFRKYAEKFYKTGYELHPGEYKTNPFSSANKVKFDLFLRYGAIPAVSDRTIAEFCPPWYLKSKMTIENWKFSGPAVNYSKKLSIDRQGRVKPLMSGKESLSIGGYTSDVVLQIRALIGNGNLITNACRINNGQISNLPENAIVASNVLISKNNVQTVNSGSLPDELAAIAIRHISNQNMIVRSVIEKDLDIAFNAFLNDPLVCIDLDSAGELYKEMLSAVSKDLVYFLN
ncbi:MAG: alpha-glucosidase/alpha-galactosidase [Oscillospiraceae bacterium]